MSASGGKRTLDCGSLSKHMVEIQLCSYRQGRIANSMNSRLFAALTALVAWVGLAVQLSASYDLTGSLIQSLWVMVRYFTVITNFIVALVFTGIALRDRRFESAPVVSGVTLAILLVGVVYGLLLRGLVELSGGAAVADGLLHKMTPILGLGYWVLFVPKGQLRPTHPLVWTLLPLAYFPYALIRGAMEGLYAYPFMDLDQIDGRRRLPTAR